MGSENDFLEIKKHYKINSRSWDTYPIVLNWINRERMIDELKIIERKVLKLEKNGAINKIKEWLFKSDSGLTDITAERFLLDYLSKNNKNLVENFFGNDTDASILIKGENIGIEVTTINKTFNDWLFKERLIDYLNYKKYKVKGIITITSPILEIDIKELKTLIEGVGDSIILNNSNYKNIKIEIKNNDYSCIQWEIEEPSYGIDNLSKKVCEIYIDKKKNKQLHKHKKNILFIGINQLPTNAVFPSIFEPEYKKYHSDQMEYLEKLIKGNMFDSVVGVCFFTYDLRQEKPFYPLNIIWKNDSEKIDINL